jgi:hypothetical protein
VIWHLVPKVRLASKLRLSNHLKNNTMGANMKQIINKTNLFVFLALFGAATVVQAAGVAAGTTISNLATINYSAGGVAQTAIGSSPSGNLVGAGTATTFVVDNKVNVTVANASATYTTVVPGSTAQVIKFNVRNLGNSTQDYSLAVTQAIATSLYSGTDNFNATGCSVFVDSAANNGVYDVGVDTAIFIDELPAQTVQAPAAVDTKAVFVVCSIPSTQVNNDQANVELTATTLVGGAVGQGAVLANNNGTADVPGSIDVVFGDAAGTGGDVANDGKHSDRGAYRVLSPVLTVTKASSLICDPILGSTNPKRIPGAIVKYTITVANAAGAGASGSLTSLADAIDTTNLDIVNTYTGVVATPTAAQCAGYAVGTPANPINVTCPAARTGGAACTANPAIGSGVTYTAPNLAIQYNTDMPANASPLYAAGELKAGETVTVDFYVKIK